MTVHIANRKKNVPYMNARYWVMIVLIKRSDVMKKYFVVTRSITEIEGKPHVETISEAELVRCKDCKHSEKISSVDNGSATVCRRLGRFVVDRDWFCANGEMKDNG